MRKDDQGYFLSYDELDNLNPDTELHERASRLLRMANGLARATHSDFQPVSLAGTFSDGGHMHSVVVADKIVIRSRIQAAGIVVPAEQHGQPPQTTPATGRSLPVSSPNIAEALTIMGQMPFGWPEFYKVFEIVRDDVTSSITKLGWATEAEIGAFTASANRPDVSGAAARHARMSGNPPRRHMSEAEARSFIGRLVTAWIDAN